MKKNNSINTISGRDAVDILGDSPSFFLLNFQNILLKAQKNGIKIKVLTNSVISMDYYPDFMHNAMTYTYKKLLKSGIGYGYWMVHNDGKGKVDWYEMTESYMNDSATINGDLTIYYGRMNGKGIGVNMTCESKNYKFTFNIRNKQASGAFPTHMMCDYKKKVYPDERPENGVV